MVIKDSIGDPTIRRYAINFHNSQVVNTTITKLVRLNSIQAIVKSCTIPGAESILIVSLATAFQFWPRRGDFEIVSLPSYIDGVSPVHVDQLSKGGWYLTKTGFNETDKGFIYPLQIEDHLSTFVSVPQNAEAWIDFGNINPSKNFDANNHSTSIFNGHAETNMYWTDGKGRYLNWKATPNRHFPINRDIEVPYVNDKGALGGVRLFNYSEFTQYLYRGGNKIAEAPQIGVYNRIIGACYNVDDHKLYIIVHVDFQESPWRYTEEIYRADGDVTKGQNWTQISTRPVYDYPTTPCFIDSNGTKFTSFDQAQGVITTGTYTYPIDFLTGKRSWLFAPQIEGTYWQDGSFTNTGEGVCWRELDNLFTVSYISASCSTTSFGSGFQHYKNVPVKVYGPPATSLLVKRVFTDNASGMYLAITGQELPSNQRAMGFYIEAYSADGGLGRYCNINWSLESGGGCGLPQLVSSGQYAVVVLDCTVDDCPHKGGYSFRVKATIAESGVTGVSNTYYFDKTNCGESNYLLLDCSNPKNSIVASNNNLTFTTKYPITSQKAPNIQWTVIGADIDGSSTGLSVNIKNTCPNVTVSVASACDNLSQSYVFASTLTATLANGFNVGDYATASGGKGPYTYSLSPGSINSSTGQVTAIPCGGGTLTVQDSCGTVITKPVISAGTWTTQSTQTAVCSVTGGGVVYQYSGSTRYKITYGQSLVPSSATVYSVSGFRALQTTQTWTNCGNTTNPLPYVSNTALLNGTWVDRGDGNVGQVTFNSGGSGWVCGGGCPSDGYDGLGHIIIYGCGTGGLLITLMWNINAVCWNFLSDSWMSGVTDANGNSVTVPTSSNGYYNKTYKVETQTCS